MKIRLLRVQVEGEAEDRRSERRAALTCRQGDRGGTGSGGIDYYSATLVNGGKATANEVEAWIAGKDGRSLVVDRQRLGSILSGELSTAFKVHLKEELSRNRNVRLLLRAA
jgi:hypothetical protein